VITATQAINLGFADALVPILSRQLLLSLDTTYENITASTQS
jgi:hypothetical protein